MGRSRDPAAPPATGAGVDPAGGDPAGAGAVAAAARAAARAAAGAQVEIRELSALPDLAAVHRLYEQLWQPPPGGEPIGMETLRAMTHAGNYTAGAYRAGELIGACVGFFAAPPGQVLHSHVAGAAARGHGIGYALKLHQRAWALARGLSTVTWTFDPLIRRNAYFNLGKLAARPREYLVDFYGELFDAVNAGQGSDRLLVAWELAAPPVVEACAGRSPEPATDGLPRALRADPTDPAGAPQPQPGWRAAGTVLVEVPDDIEQLRQQAPATARAWRYAVREVLGGLLADGARVTGFARRGGYLVDRSGSCS
jgi:predicted GNAT superfamily acetyltransferase